MKNIILVLAAATLFLTGCERSGKHGPVSNTPTSVWCRSYVMGYYEPEGIELNAHPHTSEAHPEDHVIELVVIKDRTVATYNDTEPSRKALYDFLCNKHNDLAFNQSHNFIDGGIVEFPAMDFASVEVTCDDAEFDSAHPAGTPLNDLMNCCFTSPQPYINCGYNKGGCTVHETFIYSYIEKPMPDIVPADLSLLGTGDIDDLDPDRHYTDHLGLLIFNRNVEPGVPGTYNITVKLTTACDEHYTEPRIYTATCAMDFSD